MTNDQNRRPGFLQSATGQMTLLVVAIIVVLVIAWKYVF
jgi:hypothetical protein